MLQILFLPSFIGDASLKEVIVTSAKCDLLAFGFLCTCVCVWPNTYEIEAASARMRVNACMMCARISENQRVYTHFYTWTCGDVRARLCACTSVCFCSMELFHPAEQQEGGGKVLGLITSLGVPPEWQWYPSPLISWRERSREDTRGTGRERGMGRGKSSNNGRGSSTGVQEEILAHL